MKEQEPIKSPEETGQPEVVGVETLHRAELIMLGSLYNITSEIDPDGRSIQQIAEKSSSDVIGIRTLKRVEGIVSVDGKQLKVISENFDYSGVAYIDGQVMTFEEYKENGLGPEKLISKAKSWGCNKVVKTRLGFFQPFADNDSIIILPKKGKENKD